MDRVVSLITEDKLVHETEPVRRSMNHLERIGLLVSIASRDDVSDTDKEAACDVIKSLVDARNAKFDGKKGIKRKLGIKSKKTFVYLMHHGLSKAWKIGRSVNPRRREKTLQDQDPRIELKWKTSSVAGFETFLHNKFKDKRLRGEWFDLTATDVDWIKTQALKEFILLNHG